MNHPASAIHQTLDLDAVRRDFPILSQSVNGKPLVYLDNAASTQKPQAVMDAISDYFSTTHSNVHRGAHTLGDQATAAFEGARAKVRGFLNADSTREIVWVRGTTEAINLVANGFVDTLQSGDEILLSHMEHHANIVPWQMLAKRTGAVIRVIEVTDSGELDQASFKALLNNRTKVFAITQVSNVLGTINPVKAMVAAARKVGAITLVDGAQAVPHGPVDVQDLDCDFFCFSGHKLYGPTGIGVLYGRYEVLKDWPVFMGGGEMIERVSFEGTTWNECPYRFEAGTPAIAEAIGLGAAIDYMAGLGWHHVADSERALNARIQHWLPDFKGLRVIGTAASKTPVVSFVMDGLHPSDLGTLMDQQGIAIRTGHHCAMPLMARFGVPGTARASFAFYNTPDEVDQFFNGLKKVQRLFAE